ncbi:MAG: hypothetical protein WAR57_14350 [Candidatus Phosphoribacter sp.]
MHPRTLERPRAAADPAVWIAALFGLNFLLQRVSILPNMSISASTPLVLAWMFLAWRRGVVSIDTHRAALWFVSAGFSAVVILVQQALVEQAQISLTSWAYWVITWLPIIVTIPMATVEVYRRVARAVAYVGVGIAALSGLFVGSQFAGVPYRDYVADVLPDALEVQGFVVAYPIMWGSEIHKSNAWFALEPSFLSFTLGVTALCALVGRTRSWVFFASVAGVLSTFAGSGLLVLLVGVVGLALMGQIRKVRGPLLVGAFAAVLAWFTPVRESVYGRVTELGSNGSSSALRTIEPYLYLVPEWLKNPLGMAFGYGPSSSRVIIEGLSINGLQTPNIPKMVFDYGLLVGSVMVLVLVVAHWRSPYPALGLSLLVSFVTVQTAAPAMVNCSFMLVTWWASTKSVNKVHEEAASVQGSGSSSEALPVPAR